MPDEKAARNKTIDTPLSEGMGYLERCIVADQPLPSIAPALGKTILGDMMRVCTLLPPASVDLLIVDPPYHV